MRFYAQWLREQTQRFWVFFFFFFLPDLGDGVLTQSRTRAEVVVCAVGRVVILPQWRWLRNLLPCSRRSLTTHGISECLRSDHGIDSLDSQNSSIIRTSHCITIAYLLFFFSSNKSTANGLCCLVSGYVKRVCAVLTKITVSPGKTRVSNFVFLCCGKRSGKNVVWWLVNGIISTIYSIGYSYSYVNWVLQSIKIG